jgi:site-specific DNA recombinase
MRAPGRSQKTSIYSNLIALIDAITGGVAVDQVKDKMLVLDARKKELEGLVEETDEPPALLHPNMADHYHKEVARLHEALADENHRDEAAEIVRGLVDKIVLNPLPEDAEVTMAIDLHGDLAGILTLAAEPTQPPRKGGDFQESTKLVAGARNHRQLSCCI